MLLVPTLRPYQNNSIAVDPVNLPADMVVEKTNQIVSPPDRAGVLVKFKSHSDANAALVTFARVDGSFLPAGAAGRLASGGEFVVGYDGLGFIQELASSNSVTIEFDGAQCQAAFDFKPQSTEQVHIGPVLCR